jgi:hypothetical protein
LSKRRAEWSVVLAHAPLIVLPDSIVRVYSVAYDHLFHLSAGILQLIIVVHLMLNVEWILVAAYPGVDLKRVLPHIVLNEAVINEIILLVALKTVVPLLDLTVIAQFLMDILLLWYILLSLFHLALFGRFFTHLFTTAYIHVPGIAISLLLHLFPVLSGSSTSLVELLIIL